jgi:hypothetical protein
LELLQKEGQWPRPEELAAKESHTFFQPIIKRREIRCTRGTYFGIKLARRKRRRYSRYRFKRMNK